MPSGNLAQVKTGKVLSSDLVWDCMGRTFIRADSDIWLHKPVDAEDCFMVLREPKCDIITESNRSYVVKR